jgi:hypothetical protein
MGIFNYVNPKFSGAPSVPVSTGDRYWDQDLQRDHRYYQEQLGLIYNRVFGKEKAILSGLTVLQGVGHTIDVYAGYGIAKFSVEILHRVSAWAIPPSTENDDIFILIRVPSNITNQAITSAVTDGVTVNYVKLAYLETDGNTRARAKKAGSYSYEVEPDYLLTVDDTAPTDYEIVLETFTSDGAILTFLGNSSTRIAKELNEYNDIEILGISTESKSISIGYGRTGNGFSSINFISDTTYSIYALSIRRLNSGANSASQIKHRGTGNLDFICEDAGKLGFSTSNINRLTISETGNIIVPDSGTAKFCVGDGLDGQFYSTSDNLYIENITSNKDIIFRINDGGTNRNILNLDADVSRIGVLTDTPLGYFDISASDDTMILGSDESAFTRTDLTDKYSRIGSVHYINSQEPFAIAYSYSTSTANVLSLGGGTSRLNSATQVKIYTAVNTSTTTGTLRFFISAQGKIGINESDPDGKLHITDSGEFVESLIIENTSGAADGGSYIFGKCSEDINSPQEEGDMIFGIKTLTAYSGQNYATGSSSNCEIRFERGAGTVSSSSAPGQINFLTTPNGSLTPISNFIIYEDGSSEFIGVLTYGTEYRTDTPSETTAQVKTKIIEIGDWNMNFSAGGNQQVSVAHNLGTNIYKKIRNIQCTIRNDADNGYSPLNRFDAVTVIAGDVFFQDNTYISLYINPGCTYDSANYDSTGYNRGWIYIVYEV